MRLKWRSKRTEDQQVAPQPGDAGLFGKVKARKAAAADKVGPWQHGSLAGTKTFLVLFIAALLAGPTALAWNLMATSSTAAGTQTAPAHAAAGEDSRARTRAIGAAASLVSLWLSASRDDVDRIIGQLQVPPDRLMLPDKPPASPRDIQAIDAVQTTPGEWAVTIVARGGQAGHGAAYRVLVTVTPAAALVVTLPGQIPMPSARAHVAGALALAALPSTHPVAKTVSGFTDSLLTGNGDLSRWLAPMVNLTPVQPAACKKVQTSIVAPESTPQTPSAGQEIIVLSTVACLTSTVAGQQSDRTLQYSLTLRGRDGRWEVAGYATSPTARPAPRTTTSPAGTSSPGTTPTATGTPR